jgi:hypothetical protein
MTDTETTGATPEQEPLKLCAYNVKTKEKNVPIQDAVIKKTARGAAMAQGHDGNGNKLTCLLSMAKALACIEAGLATNGWED